MDESKPKVIVPLNVVYDDRFSDREREELAAFILDHVKHRRDGLTEMYVIDADDPKNFIDD